MNSPPTLWLPPALGQLVEMAYRHLLRTRDVRSGADVPSLAASALANARGGDPAAARSLLRLDRSVRLPPAAPPHPYPGARRQALLEAWRDALARLRADDWRAIRAAAGA